MAGRSSRLPLGDNPFGNWDVEQGYAADAVSPERLPPRQLDRNEEGLLDDLIELGLLSRMHDERLNRPDVYRVAFGLGRRGGVKPVR